MDKEESSAQTTEEHAAGLTERKSKDFGDYLDHPVAITMMVILGVVVGVVVGVRVGTNSSVAWGVVCGVISGYLAFWSPFSLHCLWYRERGCLIFILALIILNILLYPVFRHARDQARRQAQQRHQINTPVKTPDGHTGS